MDRSIDEIIETFKEDDEFVTSDALASLEMKGNEAVEPLIIALSENKNKHVKIGIIKALSIIKDERAIDILVKTLKDPNKLVRRESSTALSQFGEPALEPLLGLLDDEDWKVRGAAVWALGKVGHESTIPEIEKLLDDDSGFVKSGAKVAIENIKKFNK